MMAVTAISMTLTPLLLLLNEKILTPKTATSNEEKKNDEVDEHHKVIIAGFSHFGSTIGRFLRANGVEATILDNNSDQVDLLRKMGFKVYYGDATRVDLLKSAGADEAKILIIAIGSSKATHELFETAQKHFPHLKIMVRSKNRFDAYDLMDLGVKNIYRETVHTSLQLGVDVLKSLGYRSYSATRSAQNFLKYDESALWKLASSWHDKKQYISDVRHHIELQEQLLTSDRQEDPTANDHAWDSEFMRDSINKKK
jgi:CPA2 family monovalent cation:H+ antiporter-2